MLTIIVKSKLLQQYLRHRLLINCLLLAALFLGNCFWGDMIYIVYPLLLLMVCFDNLENGLSYICFCVPFFYLKIYLSIVFYLLCLLAYIVKFYLIQYFVEKRKPNLVIVILIAVFIIYCLLPLGEYDLGWAVKLVALLAVFAILGMIGKDASVFRVQFNLRVVGIALITAALYGLLCYLSPYLRQYLRIYPVGDDFTRFKALFTQPNILAIVCEIVCAMLAYFIIARKARLADYVIFLAVTVLGLMTFSKTFLILISLIYLAIFVWLLHLDWGRTLTVASVILAMLVCFGALCPHAFSAYFGRFVGGFVSCKSFTDFMNVITTNRFNLWTVYLGFLGTHPLALIFGKGLGAAALHGWSTLSAHNFFISLVYQLGLVGTGLFVAIVVLMVRAILRRQTQPLHKAVWVPLIVFGLLLCVEDFILYIF